MAAGVAPRWNQEDADEIVPQPFSPYQRVVEINYNHSLPI